MKWMCIDWCPVSFEIRMWCLFHCPGFASILKGMVCRYTPEQVYDVVAGVDLYEEFVPWCKKSKVLSRKDNRMDAELEIGFKMFVERYISHVELKPPNLIKVFSHHLFVC